MGVYINPPNGTKEEYLWGNSLEITEKEARAFEFSSEETEFISVVVLFDNGPVTAAGVMHNELERDEFLDPEDRRPKLYYKIDKEVLTCPESGIPEHQYKYLDIRV